MPGPHYDGQRTSVPTTTVYFGTEDTTCPLIVDELTYDWALYPRNDVPFMAIRGVERPRTVRRETCQTCGTYVLVVITYCEFVSIDFYCYAKRLNASVLVPKLPRTV